MVEELLDYIPDDRIEDVIYINAADTERPVPLNPLENVDPAYHPVVASGVISLLKKIWGDSWDSRLEHILRHTLLTLLPYPHATLEYVPRLFLDVNFRNRVVAATVDDHFRDFWRKEYVGAYAANFRNEAIAPILNKVGQFLASPLMRNIVGVPHNTFDFRQVMDEGKITLVNLSKGHIGEDASMLLGGLVVTKVWLAALSRQAIPEDKRRDFYLTIDEAHSIATTSFADMLAETRKYRLNLTLAHQYIDQLDDGLRSTILGNVGILIAFRADAEDAAYVAREFEPVFSAADFVNLPQYHVYLKLLIDGIPSKGFSVVTLPQLGGKTANRDMAIERSRTRYGTDAVDAIVFTVVTGRSYKVLT